MFNTWIYLSVFFICFSGVFGDAIFRQHIKTLLKSEKCVKDNGYNLEDQFTLYEQCIVRETGAIWDAYEDTDDENDLQDLKKLICSPGSIRICLDDTNARLEKCLKDDHKDEAFIDARRSTNLARDFLCNNNDKELKEIVSPKSKACLKKQDVMNRIEDCGRKAQNIQDQWYLRSFRLEEPCKQRGQWGTCVIEALDICNDKTAMYVVQDALKAALGNSPCKHTINKYYPKLSSSSVRAILSQYLLIGLLVLSLIAIFNN